MTSSRAPAVLAYSATGLLLLGLLFHYRAKGGPYFTRPASVFDHSGPDPGPTRDLLLLVDRVAPLIPRGATVAAFRPDQGQPPGDLLSMLVVAGRLPRLTALPPYTAGERADCSQPARYVIAIREPFTNPCYGEVARFPEGRLYRRR